VPWRFVGPARAQVEDILVEIAQWFGVAAADRYEQLIFATINAVAASPTRIGSDEVPGIPGVRVFPLHVARS
jgi:plasmid stabilization system protein ParE